jgi:predicted ester cyclase
MSTTELLLQWYEEVWNKGNDAYIDQAMHRSAVIHGLDPSGTFNGMEQFKAFHKNFRDNFPTIHIKVTPLVSNEEIATGYCHVTGRSPERKEVSFTGLTVLKFKNEVMTESWNNFDFLKMYQQLGHILVSQITD